MKGFALAGFHLVRRAKIYLRRLTAVDFVVRGDMSQFSPKTRLPVINLRTFKSLLTVFYNSDVQNPARLFENLETLRATSHLMVAKLVAVALVKIKGMAIFLL
jgi:hypothetical protein